MSIPPTITPRHSPTPPPAGPLPAQAWSVPAKVVRKIQNLDFVEIAELLLEAWGTADEDDAKCCHQRHSSLRAPVTNILVWVECYAYMVAILAAQYPHKIDQLMAYQHTIVRVHRSFIRDGWILYDACYHRKAVAAKSLDWGQIDFSLYNKTFTCRQGKGGSTMQALL